MKLRPRAPSIVLPPSPHTSRAAMLFIAAGYVATALGVFLEWGIPGSLIFIGVTSVILGYRINTL